ncbi:MAG TPA: DUF72 domain-containing protein, partial [Blastocatellia bacterium]|nr:DUF72 domain-containing protein [Blastocatellia bacterium]
MAHNSPVKLYLGTAGWSIPKEYAECFPIEGAHLERYSITLPAVEINTSFYRPHRPQTYSKWADSVPEDFRFAVKMPREITHDRRLREAEQPLKTFLNEASGLSEKLGPLLVQLPRSQPFNHLVVEQFLSLLRDNFLGNVVLEPRHHSWFAQDVEQLLANYQIAR